MSHPSVAHRTTWLYQTHCRSPLMYPIKNHIKPNTFLYRVRHPLKMDPDLPCLKITTRSDNICTSIQNTCFKIQNITNYLTIHLRRQDLIVNMREFNLDLTTSRQHPSRCERDQNIHILEPYIIRIAVDLSKGKLTLWEFLVQLQRGKLISFVHTIAI